MASRVTNSTGDNGRCEHQIQWSAPRYFLLTPWWSCLEVRMVLFVGVDWDTKTIETRA